MAAWYAKKVAGAYSEQVEDRQNGQMVILVTARNAGKLEPALPRSGADDGKVEVCDGSETVVTSTNGSRTPKTFPDASFERLSTPDVFSDTAPG